jgi:F-type H+-transporting ATPase subunit a
MPHISLKAEGVLHLFGVDITNSIILSALVLLLFIVIALLYNYNAKKRNKSRLFYFVTFSLRSVYSLFESVFGEKTDYFFPLVGSFFFFILLQNWSGLLPGVGSIFYHHAPLLRANTADLNTTLSLALISVFFSQYVGVKHLGFGGYISKFINLKNPLSFFTGLMETISEISKVVSFSFRLFGNIFAGEVIITIVAFLVPFLPFISFPFFLFEVFIGFIQALVFSMLSAVFFNLAMQKAH